MGTFRPNQARIDHLLKGSGGPVYRHLETYVDDAVIYARIKAPRDTQALSRSIKRDPIKAGAKGLATIIRAGAFNPRTGENYAQSVHQGHKDIRPINARYLRFYWKKQNRVVLTKLVHATSGNPFLIKWLQLANTKLSRGKFRIKIDRQPKNTNTQ